MSKECANSKKIYQNTTILLKMCILYYDQLQKSRQIKAWYYRIDLTNPLRSYNGLEEIGIQTISLSLIWMPELFCWNWWWCCCCWCAGADGELTLFVVNDGTVKLSEFVKWVEFEAKGIWLCPPTPFDENSALEWWRPPFVWLDWPFWRIIRIWKKEIWICSRVLLSFIPCTGLRAYHGTTKFQPLITLLSTNGTDYGHPNSLRPKIKSQSQINYWIYRLS